MHAVKYETKHQHYVDEIDEVDDTVVELCWGEVVLDCGQEVYEEPVSEGVHGDVDCKQKQGR